MYLRDEDKRENSVAAKYLTLRLGLMAFESRSYNQGVASLSSPCAWHLSCIQVLWGNTAPCKESDTAVTRFKPALGATALTLFLKFSTCWVSGARLDCYGRKMAEVPAQRLYWSVRRVVVAPEASKLV